MPKRIVLVTEPEYLRGRAVFANVADFECVPVPPDEGAIADAIEARGTRYAIVGGSVYRERLYVALGRGGVLARYGVGHDGVDKVKATSLGVLCTNTPDVLHQSVAELTMAMIGAVVRHVPAVAAALVQGQWAPREGIELHGKTIAIVGCGAIGQAVAKIAVAGFGMRAIGFARRPTPLEHFESVTADFEEAVRDADVVSLHIPAHPENVHFIDVHRIALMPTRAWIVNTARGAVVDEAALYDAIAQGRLAGAALDVFQQEPYVPVDPSRDLRRLDRVLLVPHIGSNTVESNRRMSERALRNVRLGAAGEFAQMDVLNPEVLPTLRSS